eukprot:TRINITY_DN17772_c0_g1_i1.p1 TRINITY_DN17772_c0_g1~~TRINITY_DN17772_c0_g1_i1.p1  ORF type:complete len:232 (+),score=36.31 TRINITY_DN17772_c0_g1_i1:82-696(+)
MPAIQLDERHKKDLTFLSDVSLDVVLEFCRISVEFLKEGSNKKLFTGAASKLGVEPAAVQAAVEGLSFLMMESSRLLTPPEDFVETVNSLNVGGDEVTQALKKFYLQSRREIRLLLEERTPSFAHFNRLDWRLDIQLASRSLRSQTNPIYMLNLDTTLADDPNRVKSTLLQTDHTSLAHITKELEGALAEAKSVHARRIARYVK